MEFYLATAIMGFLIGVIVGEAFGKWEMRD